MQAILDRVQQVPNVLASPPPSIEILSLGATARFSR